jgi:hypothetical protein
MSLQVFEMVAIVSAHRVSVESLADDVVAGDWTVL